MSSVFVKTLHDLFTCVLEWHLQDLVIKLRISELACPALQALSAGVRSTWGMWRNRYHAGSR